MATTREELFTESKEWNGIIESAVYKESAEKKTPFLEVTFEVHGHKKCVPFWFSEKAEQQSLERLKDLGWNGSVEEPAFSRMEPVKLECKHEEYQGKWNERWNYWGEPKKYKPDASKARELAAKYKSLPSAVPPAPTTKQPPVPTKPSVPPAPTKAPPAPPTAKKAPPEEPVWRKAPPLNMEKAWEIIMERNGQDEEKSKVEWLDSIQGVTKETKVNSEDFTDQHWGYVAQYAIPF